LLRFVALGDGDMNGLQVVSSDRRGKLPMKNAAHRYSLGIGLFRRQIPEVMILHAGFPVVNRIKVGLHPIG
jgi:hypothetical protein